MPCMPSGNEWHASSPRLGRLVRRAQSGAGEQMLVNVDGDGFDDIVLEHHLLLFGSASGLVAADPALVPTSPRGATVMYSDLEIVGDVNGDGYADVMLGDPNCPFAKHFPVCDLGSVYL